MAIDYPRAIAAYKVGAKGGDAACQYQLGMMHYEGKGVALDYKQAPPWIEKAAAQDLPNAVSMLGVMYAGGVGGPSSWRRPRELYKRAIELGNSGAVKNMQTLTKLIQKVS